MTTLDEKNAVIRSMWAAGATYTEIAATLKVTKNTVVGRVSRMGLCERAAPRTNWTAQKDARLYELWIDARVSVRKIARELGLSHTNVTARANRLGLPERKQGGGSRGAVQSKRPKKRFSFGWQTTSPPVMRRPSLPREPQENIPVPQRVYSVLDLIDGKCKWPVGTPGSLDFYFCGGRAPGHVYCAAHQRRANHQG